MMMVMMMMVVMIMIIMMMIMIMVRMLPRSGPAGSGNHAHAPVLGLCHYVITT